MDVKNLYNLNTIIFAIIFVTHYKYMFIILTLDYCFGLNLLFNFIDNDKFFNYLIIELTH
jgi:hypothetical protein